MEFLLIELFSSFKDVILIGSCIFLVSILSIGINFMDIAWKGYCWGFYVLIVIEFFLLNLRNGIVCITHVEFVWQSHE